MNILGFFIIIFLSFFAGVVYWASEEVDKSEKHRLCALESKEFRDVFLSSRSAKQINGYYVVYCENKNQKETPE